MTRQEVLYTTENGEQRSYSANGSIISANFTININTTGTEPVDMVGSLVYKNYTNITTARINWRTTSGALDYSISGSIVCFIVILFVTVSVCVRRKLHKSDETNPPVIVAVVDPSDK